MYFVIFLVIYVFVYQEGILSCFYIKAIYIYMYYIFSLFYSQLFWSKMCHIVPPFFSSTFQRKKVELLSSLQCQRLGWLSFLSESISQKLSKGSIWNLEYLFTIKRGTKYNKADDPVICISRVICPCFDIVHRN